MNQIAECLDVSRFQTVEGANRKVHVNELGLEQLAHVENFFVKLLIAFNVVVLKSYLLVREQHEMVNQNLGSLFKRVFRVNGTVRCNFDNQLVVVGLLLDTIRLY